MNSSEDDVIIRDFSPRIRVYKSGRVERLRKTQIVPACSDPEKCTAVRSRDVVVSPETCVSVRIFLPNKNNNNNNNNNNKEGAADGNKLKLPLLIYVHGGAFCLQSAFSDVSHKYVSSLVSLANVIAVSVDYRLAPENPIPACYDDTWEVVQWVATHRAASGPDPWLNDHADFTRPVLLAGNSAGGNIVHDVLARLSSSSSNDMYIKVSRVALVQPFFGNNEPDGLYMFLCPGNEGPYDPRLNPAAHPELMARLPCDEVLVCVAGEDYLKDRGVRYYEALKKSGWKGHAEFVETPGVDHGFQIYDQESQRALALLKRVATFLN